MVLLYVLPTRVANLTVFCSPDGSFSLRIIPEDKSVCLENDLSLHDNANATYLLLGRCDLAVKVRDQSTTTIRLHSPSKIIRR